MSPNFFDVYGEYPEVQQLSLEEAARQLREHVQDYKAKRLLGMDPKERAEYVKQQVHRQKVCEIQLCLAAMGAG